MKNGKTKLEMVERSRQTIKLVDTKMKKNYEEQILKKEKKRKMKKKDKKRKMKKKR